MASYVPNLVKISPEDISTGDIAVKFNDITRVLGTVECIKHDDINDYDFVLLEGGDKLRLSHFLKTWYVYDPSEYTIMSTKPWFIRLDIFSKVAEANELNEKITSKWTFPSMKWTIPDALFLYKLTLHPDIRIENEDNPALPIVKSMIIAAPNPKEAKIFTLTYDHIDESKIVWGEPRYILCETIGIVYNGPIRIVSGTVKFLI